MADIIATEDYCRIVGGKTPSGYVANKLVRKDRVSLFDCSIQSPASSYASNRLIPKKYIYSQNNPPFYIHSYSEILNGQYTTGWESESSGISIRFAHTGTPTIFPETYPSINYVGETVVAFNHPTTDFNYTYTFHKSDRYYPKDGTYSCGLLVELGGGTLVYYNVPSDFDPQYHFFGINVYFDSNGVGYNYSSYTIKRVNNQYNAELKFESTAYYLDIGTISANSTHHLLFSYAYAA